MAPELREMKPNFNNTQRVETNFQMKNGKRPAAKSGMAIISCLGNGNGIWK
jgi:hypothetical protein